MTQALPMAHNTKCCWVKLNNVTQEHLQTYCISLKGGPTLLKGTECDTANKGQHDYICLEYTLDDRIPQKRI